MNKLRALSVLQHRITGICLLALLSSLSLSVSASEETRYVSDRMTLPLRSDKSEKARFTNKNLIIGSTVKVLREDTASGFSQVDAGNGTQGWIQTRYLTRDPTAMAKLAALEKKPATPPDTTLQKEIGALKEENKKLLEQNRATQQQLEEIHQASGNVVKLMEQNRDLIEKNQLLQSKVDTLEAVKEKFRDNSSMDQFIYGGILVIATLVVSTLIESWRRRRSFSTWG